MRGCLSVIFIPGVIGGFRLLKAIGSPHLPDNPTGSDHLPDKLPVFAFLNLQNLT